MKAVTSPPELGLGAGVLDSLFDDILNFVPVLRIHPLDSAVKVLLDLVEHIPLFPVGDERDGDTHTAETSGTTDTVQVGLEVRLAFRRAGLMKLWDVLGTKLVFISINGGSVSSFRLT